MQFPSKFQHIFFTNIERKILTFICKNIWRAIIILKNIQTSTYITIPDFKLYYTAIIIKFCCIGIETDKLINVSTINIHTYGHLIFYNEAKTMNRKGRTSLTNGLTGCLHVIKCKLNPIILHKTQVQMDQIPQFNTIYIKPNGIKDGGYLCSY